MGNLRQSMTDSEWNEMEREIQREKNWENLKTDILVCGLIN